MLTEIEIKTINHLGIVAGIIDELDILNIINQELGRDEQEIVNSGEIVTTRAFPCPHSRVNA